MKREKYMVILRHQFLGECQIKNTTLHIIKLISNLINFEISSKAREGVFWTPNFLDWILSILVVDMMIISTPIEVPTYKIGWMGGLL